MSTKHRPSNLDLDKLKSASDKKFAIVCSDWNPEIINRLLEGAYDFFQEIGISKNKIYELKFPGSFELIFRCHKVQSSKKYDAILAIGSVIRGETSHCKYISQSVFDGIKDLNTNGNSPIILCLLTWNKRNIYFLLVNFRFYIIMKRTTFLNKNLINFYVIF